MGILAKKTNAPFGRLRFSMSLTRTDIESWRVVRRTPSPSETTIGKRLNFKNDA